MLKRNWVLVAALGLVSSFSAVALSWGGEQSAIKPQQITSPRDEDAASGGNAGPDNEQPEAADDLTSVLKQIEAAIGDLKPREDGDERQEQEDRDKRDLTAQESMAVWAERMFWATIGTILVAIVGIVYVRRTLLETRRIGKAQVRAYLTCTGGKYVVGQTHSYAWVTFRNSGQSPAKRCSLRARIAAPDVGDDYVGRDIKFSQYSRADAFSVAAGSEGMAFVVFPRDLIAPLVQRALYNKRMPYTLDCTFEWTDVFDEAQTGACTLIEDTSRWNTGDIPKTRTGKMKSSNRHPYDGTR